MVDSSGFRHDCEVSERGDQEALKRLARAVRHQREAVGFVQEEVAHRAAISVRHYQTLESGKLNVSYLVLKAVAAALQSSVAQLAETADEVRASPSRRRILDSVGRRRSE